MTVLLFLENGDIIYRSDSKSVLHKLYHTCICFVSAAPFNTHHWDLYEFVKWFLIHSCRRFVAIVSFTRLIGKTPYNLSSLLNIYQYS